MRDRQWGPVLEQSLWWGGGCELTALAGKRESTTPTHLQFTSMSTYSRRAALLARQQQNASLQVVHLRAQGGGRSREPYHSTGCIRV